MPRTKAFCEVTVLEKAMELFWKKGYNATSVKDLVCHLGINRASMYDTYGGKKTLFTRAFQHYRTINKKRIQTFLGEQSSVKKGFRNLFLTAIDTALEDTERKGCFVLNCAAELIPNEEDFDALILENQQDFELIFRDFLQSGVENGEITADKDIDAVAAYIYTFYGGLQVSAKINSNKPALVNTVLLGLSVLDWLNSESNIDEDCQ